MYKKIITLIIITISIAIISIGCNKKNEINKAEKTEVMDHKLNPISKENALNVLKSEYGEMITTTIDDIKEEGEEYIVEVYIDSYIEPTIDDASHDESQDHDHRESIGTHKINIYTGELIKPKSDK
ncbi:MAG: hypothetical protein ACRC1Y_04030 [Paraclostridium sp.]